MADEENITRKLPPISPRPKSESTVKRKKKRPPTDDPHADTPSPTLEKPVRHKRNKVPTRDDETEAEKPVRRKKKKSVTTELSEDGGDNKLATESEKPIRKKKVKSRDSETDVNTSTPNINTADNTETEPIVPKKKKRKKKETALNESANDDGYTGTDSGFAAELTSIEDDVVERDRDEELPEKLPASTATGTILKSVPTSKLFIETQTGFKGEKKSTVAKRRAEEVPDEMGDQEVKGITTLDLALSIHRVLLTGMLFIHGVTAGIALWHIIIVYIIASNNQDTILTLYQPFAQPVQCMYYVLLGICTVSAMDRSDVGYRTKQFFVRVVTMQSGAVAVVLYFIALLLSLSLIGFEEKLNLWKQFAPDWILNPNKTWEDYEEGMKNVQYSSFDFEEYYYDEDTTKAPRPKAVATNYSGWLITWGIPYNEPDDIQNTTKGSEIFDFTYTITIWRNLNAARSIAAILGWVVLAMVPKADQLSKNLKREDNVIHGVDVYPTSKA